MTDLPDRPPRFVLSMVIAVCFATAFILATPGFVLLMAAHWGYGGGQLGLFVTADSIGSAAGPLLLSGLMSRLPVRRIVVGGALGFAAGNALTALHPDFGVMLASRVLSGTSSGVIAALGVRYLALSAQSERNLAWMTIGQTLYSALLLTLVLPTVGDAAKAPGAFGLLALQALLCLPLVTLFRRDDPLTADHRGAGLVQHGSSAMCLLATLSLNTAVGIVWTFVGHQGIAAGLSDAATDRVLGLANLLSIAGCAMVPWAVRSGRLYSSAIAALSLCAVAALALALAPQPGLFVAASIVYVVAWAAAITLMMTAMPGHDPVGRYVMLIPTALCIGNGVGAAIGGALVESHGTSPAFGVAAGCCALSAGLFAVLRQRSGHA